ncbi:hypothetical protein H8D30_02125 [bacterium]|nr:hypothetical protein [bacterium]
MAFGPRRGVIIEIDNGVSPLSDEEVRYLKDFDALYRCLVSAVFNYCPRSGHPGGSVSSGRFVASLLFRTMAYDIGNPERMDADLISYGAGHKALGLYAMWALRDEVARVVNGNLLPSDQRLRLRMEDLLGFRRNPVTTSPRFVEFGCKTLDGHPTPATPFLRLSTGASGVGTASSIGLAFGAADHFGDAAPKVHIIEGEGGMTPGRVAESMAAAGTSCLGNAIMHIDWNQASIDSDAVCRDGDTPGDYVQWDPAEFAYLHDWNVIRVDDGFDFQKIAAAQDAAMGLENGQPTAIVYRTVKGWRYGIEGRKSHGAGHALCSEPFQETLSPLREWLDEPNLPTCRPENSSCTLDQTGDKMEDCYWQTLQAFRRTLEGPCKEMAVFFSRTLQNAKERLESLNRKPHRSASDVERVYALANEITGVPEEMSLVPGTDATLRGELGRSLSWFNSRSGGAFLAGSADLMGSTSTNKLAEGFDEGLWNRLSNPGSRLLSAGGICEDGLSGILSGVSSFGAHIGVGSSYGAFMAPLGHISARLHAIGCQSHRETVPNSPYKPFFLVCAHASLKTGEDGPTHADPQALQLLQGNFPKGTAITLTPWDPAELFPLVTEALVKRPAVIAPFVTRPGETVLDRGALGLPPVTAAKKGVYPLRYHQDAHVTVVLQGSAATYAFLQDALPTLDTEGVQVNAFYVASEELFDLLPSTEQEEIFPASLREEAFGITDFTFPTLYRWVSSERGRLASLYPFKGEVFLGSGQGHRVVEQAGLDGAAQVRAIHAYLE